MTIENIENSKAPYLKRIEKKTRNKLGKAFL